VNDDPKVQFEVEFLSGPRDGEVVRIEADEAIIGREAECELSVPADTVMSRKHARIRCSDTEISIEDLESGYGTLVNDEKVGEMRILGETDVVRAGNVEFVCRLPNGESTDLQQTNIQAAQEISTSSQAPENQER
jgi:pSer/pThr/pTyr-binding forkhead associated (FHA) protein